MLWLQKISNIFLGFMCLLFGLVSGVCVLPFILICFIVILTPPPFAMIVNIIFPIHFFLGPDGAKTCLQGLLSAVRYILDKALGFFRAAKDANI